MSEASETPSESGPFWALLSGGKDSVATAAFLAETGRLKGCVHLDTGVAAPDTMRFVRGLCDERGWDLRVFRTPVSYDRLVLKLGFPKGPRGHQWFYRYLKDRPLRLAAKALGPDALFASGVRSQESARRMLSARRWSKMRGGWIYAPILEWSDRRVWAYLAENELGVSPCSLSVGISGDCLCGAFSRPGECAVIAKLYPEFAARILALERESKRGYPLNRWGNRSTGFSGARGMLRLEDFVCTNDCRAVGAEGDGST